MSMLQNNEISVVAFYCSAELLGLKLKKSFVDGMLSLISS